jgi:hypothetical protein
MLGGILQAMITSASTPLNNVRERVGRPSQCDEPFGLVANIGSCHQPLNFCLKSACSSSIHAAGKTIT